MALSINLTLVVQAFHFMLAYWFISQLFLKPAYKVLEREVKKLSLLRSRVIEEQEKLALKQEHKRRGWQECQNYFQTQRPAVEQERAVVTEKVPTIAPVKALSAEEKEMLTHEVSIFLKSKVTHD